MKKLVLSACLAACFAAGAMAQEQDTTGRDRNQYRNDPLQQDTTQQDDQFRDDPLQQDTTQQDDPFRDDPMQDSTQQQSDQYRTDPMNEESDTTEMYQGNEAQEMDTTSNDLQQGDEKQSNEYLNESDSLLRDQQRSDPTYQNDSTGGEGLNETAAVQPQEPIEVVEDKEGPNNEVVYEFKGDTFYVDREKKEIVKVKKSDLKDSPHDVMVKEETGAKDDSDSAKKKSKG